MRTRAISRGMTAWILLATLVLPLIALLPLSARGASARGASVVPHIAGVEGQPLGANARRLLQALETLGAPLSGEEAASIEQAAAAREADRLQELLDPHVLCAVAINPELRVKVLRGPATAALQQGGFTPFVIKVINEATLTRPLRFSSPQAGPLYSGASLSSLTRQAQPELNENENKSGTADRFLQVEMQTAPPLTKELSGLKVEYAVALVYSQEAGRREATLAFDVGAGTQDLGFRGEVPVLFQIQPAIPVRLSVRDHDDLPTVGCFTFRDRHGRIHPPQAKRLAPDFFFQPHIYRGDDGVVLLPPGEFHMESSRGPEYRVLARTVRIPAAGPAQIDVRLERWVNPQDYGFYCGDHHIHGAGCAHYESPTQGVTPEDMFLQVKGEGLNVGCVLTWGPCFDFQRQYFAPVAHDLSEPLTVLKYDLEISGFGSAPLGHVCLLNLRNQTYPGSESTRGWPTWTVPVLRWTKEQGGVTGYPHSALQVDPPAAAKRMFTRLDRNADGLIEATEAEQALLPEPFAVIDADRDRTLTEIELVASHERAADVLPNLVSPEMNGGGALEICVSTAEGVCDFVSAMDTPRLSEWNTWYHLLNCGFPLKVSGETDFPCMSSRRVGQGRVYVQLGRPERLDFSAWCRGLAEGRSYVSDGFAHALQFTVAGKVPGPEEVRLDQPGTVVVKAKVAFSPETPNVVAQGEVVPIAGRRVVGDTRVLHAPRTEARVVGGERLVEIVVNGRVAASVRVPANGREHGVEFNVPIERSSWVALRHFPQMHTNPVSVVVAGRPLRISRSSARWCMETIEQLWERRQQLISEPEREAAHAAYQRALERYRQIAGECPEGS